MTDPAFIYHPDPIKTGAFKPEQAICACCQQVSTPVYRGPFYALDEVEALCPSCIASGAAAEKFDGMFSDVWVEEGSAPPGIISEIGRRTPGYESWQGNIWLYHCNDGCEFHGNAAREDIMAASPETIRYWEETNRDSWDEWIAPYVPGGSLGVYKFVCRHCGLVLFHWDMS